MVVYAQLRILLVFADRRFSREKRDVRFTLSPEGLDERMARKEETATREGAGACMVGCLLRTLGGGAVRVSILWYARGFCTRVLHPDFGARRL